VTIATINGLPECELGDKTEQHWRWHERQVESLRPEHQRRYREIYARKRALGVEHLSIEELDALGLPRAGTGSRRCR